jgi:transposase
MREGLFWLDDWQWSSIKGSYRAGNGVGPRRVDDRRVISGIIHVLQSGMRWRDCPKEYGPSTTIYNRWHRWSQQALRQRMFNELSQIVGTHYENAIDSTAIKVHRSARSKKGGQDQALGMRPPFSGALRRLADAPARWLSRSSAIPDRLHAPALRTWPQERPSRSSDNSVA